MTSTSSGSGRNGPRQPPTRSATPLDTSYPVDEFDVDYEPGQRRGAHRTATPAVLEQLPFLLAALAVVVVVVVVIGLLAGGEDPPAAAPTVTSGAPASSDPTATGSTTAPPSATTTPPATTEPPVSSSPAPTADRSVALVVLNGTSTSGLAGDVGAELEVLGWTVGTVGNAPQKPVEATVVLYSDPEQQATAEAVAADLDATAELDDTAAGQVVVVVGTDRA